MRADGGPMGCSISPSDVRVLGEDSDPMIRTAALAAGPDRFGVLWNVQDFSATGTGQPDLLGRHIRSSGVLGVEHAITSDPFDEGVPTIAAVGTGFVGAFPGYDVLTIAAFTEHFDADLTPTAPRVRASDPGATNAVFRAVVQNLSSGPMLAYSQELTAGGNVEVLGVPLNADGTPSGSPMGALPTGARPVDFFLAEVEAGPVIIWSETVSGAAGVFLQRLTTGGAMNGTAKALTDQGDATGTLDIAVGRDGGAIAFGALQGGSRPQVRFRRVAPNGDALDAERIIPTEGAARDGSIAMFAGGYAVSLRQGATASEAAGIYLYLLTASGFELEHIRIADAAEEGGRTTVRVSGDGQIGIAWHDSDDDSSTVSFALVRCGS